MTSQGGTPPVPSFNDLLDTWRQAATETEQRWNDFLNEMMGTEAFGQVMARSMDSYLSMQGAFARGMEQYLRALNIPTRTDVNQIAERVALLEQKIDTVAAMLGAEQAEAPGASHNGTERPRRTGRKTGKRADS